MTNKDDIVIPRDELPTVLGSISINGEFVSLADGSNRWGISQSAAHATRAYAMNYLALAEAIDRALAEDELKRSKAEDAKRLTDEADALCKFVTRHAYTSESGYWKNVARAARELYGK